MLQLLCWGRVHVTVTFLPVRFDLLCYVKSACVNSEYDIYPTGVFV